MIHPQSVSSPKRDHIDKKWSHSVSSSITDRHPSNEQELDHHNDHDNDSENECLDSFVSSLNHQYGQQPHLPVPPTITNSSHRSVTGGIAATAGTNVNQQKKSGYTGGFDKIAAGLQGSIDSRQDTHNSSSNSHSHGHSQNHNHLLTVENATASALMDMYSEDGNDEDFSVGKLLSL